MIKKKIVHIAFYIFVCFLGALVSPIFMSCDELALQEKTPYRVLIIQSFQESCLWAGELNKGAEDCFKRLRVPYVFEIVNMDCEGLDGPEEVNFLKNMLDTIQTPDLILVCDDQATFSLLVTEHELTHTVPIVFSGVDYFNQDLLKGHDNITGYTTKPDYKKCCQLIQTLYPDINAIVLDVDNTYLGRTAAGEFRKQVPEISDSVNLDVENMDITKGKFIMWSATYAVNTARIMPIWNGFYSARAKNTEVPFFAVNNEGFGYGYLGGYMTTSYDQTYLAAERGIQILSGRPVSDFPISPSKQTLVFDWKQMQKCHIQLEQLPQDCEIIHYPFIEKYRKLLIMSLVFVILVILVGTLGVFLLYRGERKQKRNTQKKLQIHRNNLKIIMSSIHEGVISIDCNMKIFAINSAALRWLHLPGSGSDYIGRTVLSIIDVSGLGKEHYLKTMIASVFNNERPIHFEYSTQMILLDRQSSFPVMGGISAIYRNFKLYGAVITFHDITKEFTQKEFLALTLGASNISSWRYDEIQKRIVFDPAFFVTFNVEDDGSHSISLERFRQMIHPEDMQSWKEMNDEWMSAQSRDKYKLQLRVNFNGKGYQWWECRLSKLPVSSERLLIFGLCINIQKFKQTQKALVQAREKALMSDKLKSAFLANMSHEIRTPLNAIVGFSNLLTSCDDDFEAEERQLFIETIQNNCNLLLALISDILDLAQIESGSMLFKEELCDVNELIYQIVMSQQVIIPDHLRLIEKCPADTVYIIIDKLRLNQVLTNLINNAVKFTEQGSVTVGYTKEDNDYLTFFVEDTGCGIPEKDLKKVFDRFFKKDEFTQGAGLGLSICRMIVDHYNGRMEVSSKEKAGSRFSVHIPYIEGEETNIIERNISNNKSFKLHNAMEIENNLTSPANVVTLLIAEDEDSNYLLLKTILRKHCNLHRAKTGKEALQLFQEIPDIDLILLDIKMPEMTGIEALKEIRKISTEIPVIMQSAYVFDSDMEAARQAGASDFITKPINLKILKSTISKYCPAVEW